MENLEQLILNYQNAKSAYYNGDSIMTDEEFDFLEEKLVELGYDPKVGYVDVANNDSDKVQHGIKMLSLGKIKILKSSMDIDIAEKLFKQYGKGKLSWKYDGIAINLRYTNGKLINASTRGNGNEGRNVMYKLKSILPQNIDCLNDVELRFEAVMKTSIFNEKYASKYNHPRNLVAGIFRDENENDSRINDVNLVLLEAIEVKTDAILDISNFQEFKDHKTEYEINSIEDVKNVFDNCSKIRFDYSFGTDGLVYTSNEFKYFLHNGHHPDHAIAIKFMPPVLISEIEKITWNLQRTGSLKPIIHFKTLIVDGRKISKASGYNLNYLIENDLCQGKKVQIILSNDIIPRCKPLNS